MKPSRFGEVQIIGNFEGAFGGGWCKGVMPQARGQ